MASRYRDYLRNDYTLPTWRKAYQEVFDVCEQVYRNNEYLLRKNNITKYQQRKEWMDIWGLQISPFRESRIRNGRIKNVSIYTLEFVALYWGVRLSELISRDYYGEQAMRIVNGEQGNEPIVSDSRSFRRQSLAQRKAKAKPDPYTGVEKDTTTGKEVKDSDWIE